VIIEVWLSCSEPTIIRRAALVQQLSVRKDPTPGPNFSALSKTTLLLLNNCKWSWKLHKAGFLIVVDSEPLNFYTSIIVYVGKKPFSVKSYFLWKVPQKHAGILFITKYGKLRYCTITFLQSNNSVCYCPNQIQKEMLDTELDIISRQQEGGDLVPLYKKLHALKTELQALAPMVHIPSKPPGVRPAHPRHHPYYYNPSLMKKDHTKTALKPVLGHRPTKLLVSGYENDDKEAVLQHFRVSRATSPGQGVVLGPDASKGPLLSVR